MHIITLKVILGGKFDIIKYDKEFVIFLENTYFEVEDGFVKDVKSYCL